MRIEHGHLGQNGGQFVVVGNHYLHAHLSGQFDLGAICHATITSDQDLSALLAHPFQPLGVETVPFAPVRNIIERITTGLCQTLHQGGRGS